MFVQNIDRKKDKPYQYGYDVYEEDGEQGKNVLSKYDEEIDGAKKTSFTIGNYSGHQFLGKQSDCQWLCSN